MSKCSCVWFFVLSIIKAYWKFFALYCMCPINKYLTSHKIARDNNFVMIFVQIPTEET